MKRNRIKPEYRIARFRLKPNITAQDLLDAGGKMSDFAISDETRSEDLKICFSSRFKEKDWLSINLHFVASDVQSWSDYHNVIVLDENFCQPYTPFYGWLEKPNHNYSAVAGEVISLYNNYLRSLSFLEEVVDNDQPERSRIYQQLDIVSQLDDGWDGYESPPFSAKAIQTTAEIIKQVQTFEFELFPSAAGVQLEYSMGDNYVEFIVANDGKVTSYIEVDGSNTELEIQPENAGKVLENFIDRSLNGIATNVEDIQWKI